MKFNLNLLRIHKLANVKDLGLKKDVISFKLNEIWYNWFKEENVISISIFSSF